eukprot:CAMPEP_0174748158 /NCGR_PEP_ID=MMETSP1094-20130205/92791_1 /TAXON_ID=156173 /ORGANISM="Chrysochromulina brevifilum, Strain UTEX LB 985" /LENGTH=88 /DNA_ID=CAMNT_0015953147 /DNA_START=96 /DNA_END=362 /DNA_ORIENTATION=-
MPYAATTVLMGRSSMGSCSGRVMPALTRALAKCMASVNSSTSRQPSPSQSLSVQMASSSLSAKPDLRRTEKALSRETPVAPRVVLSTV